jgi:2'-5' RNA ligase
VRSFQALIRAFLAVVPPPIAQQAVSTLSDNLQNLPDSNAIRWSRSNAHHITLEFLGDIEEATQALVKSVISDVVRSTSPFRIRLSALIALPGWRKMRVLAVGIDDPKDELPQLQSGIAAALRNAGFEPDARAYHPHLTLGRVRKGTPANLVLQLSSVLEAHNQTYFEAWDVTQVSLIQSHLGSGAPRYETLAHFKLEGKV